ncbi:UDP-4-amino-4,6-dideoxy-N-acetyl-beta-L-altrosamine N-acetyltransferase [Ectothiorhodospira shaposhnikovii]|uniref:UDP-4-amino-4, 6-dideoxy-N-acetyl-beta-L-altrosamine N-acetyltransferase n=1 Tax=Ectothiorhodospira shaposhnikovii TaxID=1054 RepID=UPI0039A03F45
MSENDLEYVLRWRNHPDIRRFMLSQHEITLAEHQAWFGRASRDEARALLVIEEHGQPRGCVIFSGVHKNATAEWSFYSAPGNPAGTGTRICAEALNFAFNELDVHKVAGKVLDFNHPSIRVHQRLGFTQEGNLREHSLINGTHHNLLCFGILSGEWLSLNKNMNDQ